MGQRSQIYVRIRKEYVGGPRSCVVANYYQSCCDFDMVSRARHTVEYLLERQYEDGSYYLRDDVLEKLARIIDVDFDRKTVLKSCDIVREWAEGFKNTDFKEHVFFSQDNNDGKLFIDVLDKDTIKYAFTDNNLTLNNVMDATGYMDWDRSFEDESSENHWTKSERYETFVKNHEFLQNHATKMTGEEVRLFLFDSYQQEIFPPISQTTAASIGRQINEIGNFFDVSFRGMPCHLIVKSKDNTYEKMIIEMHQYTKRASSDENKIAEHEIPMVDILSKDGLIETILRMSALASNLAE